jgi:ATP-binding cassette subfamily G (WHITE) protein 2 (SNQ2)
MLSTELHDLRIECLDREYKVFSPPAGQTCLQWAAPYMGVVGGYLNNESATADCQYCPYRTGDGALPLSRLSLFPTWPRMAELDFHLRAEFYTPLGISFDNRWRDREYTCSLHLALSLVDSAPVPAPSVGILIAFVVFNIIVTVIASRFLRYAKR